MKKNDTNSNTLKLGPRMTKIVTTRLADTLIQYRYCCAGLAKIEQQLLACAENPETDYISKVPIDMIIECVSEFAGESEITKKLYQNVMHDIKMKSKHYRTWNNDSLYLTETYVESFRNYSEIPKNKVSKPASARIEAVTA